jgi:crossover junction endodeoxyribonuclease RuvC
LFKEHDVKIMGIDPGIASTGYGVIETAKHERLVLIDNGMITTSPKMSHGDRLKYIYGEITNKLEEHRPDALAIESLFHSRNLKALGDVSEAIGVVTLAASNFNIAVTKFTPLKVKSAIVGFGKADKGQVQEMIMRLLDLETLPKPHHVSDALAVAICYSNLT